MQKNIFLNVLVAISLAACATNHANNSENQKRISPSIESQVRNKIDGLDSAINNPQIPDEKRADLLLEKAKLLLKIHAYREATVVLTQLENSRNGYHLAHLNHYLGSAYFGMNDYQNAIVHFRKSDYMDQDFEANERTKMWAQAYYEENQYGPALAVLGKAAQKRQLKKDLFFYETASRSFLKIREFKKCELMIQEGLSKYPDSKALLDIRGDLDQALGRNSR